MRVRRKRGHAGGVSLIAAAAVCLGASASAPAQIPHHQWQAELEAFGPEHAAEHAEAARRGARTREAWLSLPQAERREDAERARAHAARFAARTAGDPSEVGSWTGSPFPINDYAIHAVLLPTGKVLMWGYPPFAQEPPHHRPNSGSAFIWDPSQGTGEASMRQVNPPEEDHDGDPDTPPIPGPIYCSGQTLLASGEVLAVGGNLVWPENDPDDEYVRVAGWQGAYTFNPWTEEWVRQPDEQTNEGVAEPRRGRWYPSQVLLGDGDTVILAGYDETATAPPEPHARNNDLEVFRPGATPGSQGSFTHHPQGDRAMSLYPHLFTLPSGDVLLAGPATHDTDLLQIGGAEPFEWRGSGAGQIPDHAQDRIGGNAVLMPQGPDGSYKVSLFGGFEIPPFTDSPATRTVEQIDASDPLPEWRTLTPQHHGRSYGNTVILPDGSLVTIGGGSGRDSDGSPYTGSDELRRVELYDRTTDTWTLGPAQMETRAYHSIALLLPDGRVLSAGDDFNPGDADAHLGASTSDTAEVYSPPYLFRGPRPKPGAVPASARWGDAVGVRVPDEDLIAKAVLMAPGAVTHGADMHQRQVPLRFTRVPGVGVDLEMPAHSNIAPPGRYMLFFVNRKGVPSVAKWVRLGDDAPDRSRLEPDRLPPRAGLRLLSGRRLALRRGILRARAFISERGRLEVSARLRRLGGRAASSPRRHVRLVRGADARIVRFKLPRRRVRRLAQIGGRIAVVARAFDAAGNRRVVRRRIRL